MSFLRRLSFSIVRFVVPSLAVTVIAFSQGIAGAQDREVIPHAQDKPPGPALSPAEALSKMQVPEGFSVEVVASEPDVVNPVAMTIDHRGRFWITESLEYPRRSPGKGRDRVKILEDTDGDGKIDKTTIFADGLNIPSGIALGYGGVWVANAPDILFMQDTDGDDQADTSEVVVTGLGRDDTHELPNSLTWGPDGWLYGLNGVFNRSRVEHQGKVHEFTCALFRIHPRTREFELFAEGTSNPWGVAWNNEGSAFISACVIDHLWHLTESGYYHRQGGPYPPFTWKLESIVDYRHQKAAYCGLHFFDSDAYPPEYRERLYMGNIHGNCLNVDRLHRDGATYRATGEEDFLSANDAWFMPVVQKTGPDGCLYVLDWYDRYHCYQDANRDPEGIDRLKGRLYRIRYKDTPRAGTFNLAEESDAQLIERLHSPNVYYRDLAQRLLAERRVPETISRLQELVLDADTPQKTRMHALFAVVSSGPLDEEFHQALLVSKDSTLRAWGVRAAGNMGSVSDAIRQRIVSAAEDRSPDVQVQVAIAATKIDGIDPLPVLVAVARHCGADKLIPHIVWQNLHPRLPDQADGFVRMVSDIDMSQAPAVAQIVPRAFERLVTGSAGDIAALAELLEQLTAAGGRHEEIARDCWRILAERLQTRQLRGAEARRMRESLNETVASVLEVGGEHPLHLDVASVAASWGDSAGLQAVRDVMEDASQSGERRIAALEALIASGDAELLQLIDRVLKNQEDNSAEFRGSLLAALGRYDNPQLGELVLSHYDRLEPSLRPRAIELLTQRPAWAKSLLAAIGAERIPADVLNVNQARRLATSRDSDLAEMVGKIWGTVRTERDPKRDELIDRMRSLLAETPGDPHRGQAVFEKVCGQCHKIHGQGEEVGPDITSNGRGSFEQLLSNVFDPSLVIGASYQAVTIATIDGRVLTGLPVEDSPQRVVLKMQGGKTETLPRDEIDQMQTSRLSMMPEGVEDQLKPQEIADLFAFLMLDRPPSDPAARRLPQRESEGGH
ncbi:MAG: PVC-type heme-binding CxxCH protein [Pirellulales bacterium]